MMSEGAFAYTEDVATRSKIATSAKRKANGTAVVKLGNKPVTQKEIAEKHGPCYTYPVPDNLMNYSDFMRLPDDLKCEFVNKMMDRYDISMRYISKHLFNKGDDGLRAILDKKKLLKKEMNRKRSDTKENIERFRIEVEDWKEVTRKAKEIDRIQAKMRQASCPKPMNYKSFKKLSPEQQADFMNRMIKYYQVPSSIIAQGLFKIRPSSLCNHFQKIGITKNIVNLPLGKIRNRELMAENEAKFLMYIEAWEDFAEDEETEVKEEPKVIDIQPMLEVKKTEEESREVIHETLRKIAEMSDSEIEEKAKEILSSTNLPKNLPPDEEFELECVEEETEPTNVIPSRRDYFPSVCTLEEVEAMAKAEVIAIEPEPEPKVQESDPLEYHEMHFSTSYISSEINMDEIYAMVAFFKRCKRIKVNIEITEV